MAYGMPYTNHISYNTHYHAIPYDDVAVNIMFCYTIPYHIMPCHAMPCHTIPYHMI